MNLRLLESLPSELSVRLALVLLHSLWQASLLAMLLWLALRALAPPDRKLATGSPWRRWQWSWSWRSLPGRFLAAAPR